MTARTSRVPVPGRATSDGTSRYASGFTGADRGHFRTSMGLRMSSVGIGTYLGEADDDTDHGYRTAMAAALASGCNVIDSAINYRYQFSERAVGDALAEAFGAGRVQRDEVVVCTKGGYLSFDGPPSNARAWVQRTFVDPGILTWSDIVAHNVMQPAYIRHQVAASLDNLGLETIDLYYLHNPESQLQSLSRSDFLARMAACFQELEMAVSAGMIGAYGVATWDAFRADADAQPFVSIEELVGAAASVAGPGHHFAAVQLPISLGMPEGLVKANQMVKGECVSALEAAARLGLTAVASGSLMQGRLSELPAGIRSLIPGDLTDPQRALQFVRSAPGVTTALVGMKTEAHVRENLALASVPPLTGEEFAGMFA